MASNPAPKPSRPTQDNEGEQEMVKDGADDTKMSKAEDKKGGKRKM